MTQPTYYNNFTCTASSCPFTCCQQWRIAVDDETLEDWKGKKIPESALTRICGNIYIKNNVLVEDGKLVSTSDFIDEAKTLDAFTISDSSGASISLCSNGFCPYLNEQGLCDIVLTYGEETISNTCHTFPREEHVFESVTEKTLALGCPAVVDLLCRCEEFEIEESTENKGRHFLPDEQMSATSFGNEHQLISVRNRLIELISNKYYPLKDSIRMMFYILLDMFDKYEEGGDDDFLTDDYINSYFSEAFLGELYDQISSIAPDEYDNMYEQNELFLDIVDSYRKKGMYSDILNPLVDIASRYEEEDEADAFARKRRKFEPVWNGLEDKLRLVVAEEIYSTLYLPEGDLYSMVLKAQWLGMTFAVLKQMVFLKWECKGTGEIFYEEFREILCVLIRMTGYSEEDIEEYLENSFEDIIWDWGYMSLIVG